VSDVLFSQSNLTDVIAVLIVLWAVAGPFLLVLGWLGIRAINASEGRLRGRAVAVAALVLGGLGVAAGMLFFGAVVIQQYRDKSQRLACANNLRQIGLAVNLYCDSAAGRFPTGAVPDPALPPEERLSWMVEILPLLGTGPQSSKRWQAVYDRARLARPWGDTEDPGVYQVNVPFYMCPGDPGYEPRQHPGRTDHPGLAGINPDAPRLPADSPRAGIFGYDLRVRREDVTRGLSHTILAIESTQDTGPWLTAGPTTVRGVDPDVIHYIGAGRPFGGCHVLGANALLADGSAGFLAQTISPRVFRAMVPFRGEEPETAP
jgi:hypothetical protein